MATEVVVDVLGRAVGIRVDASVPGAPSTGALAALLADLRSEREPERWVEAVVDGGEVRMRDSGAGGDVGVVVRPELLAETLVWQLNEIAASSDRHVVVHAACVAPPGGPAVLLPGASGAGKSTLALACLARGWAYLSDEHAAIDLATGDVVPVPKPLHVRGGLVTRADAGGAVAGDHRPGAVVLARYRPGGDAAVHRLTPAATLAGLAAHTANLRLVGERGFLRLAEIAAGCPGRQVDHGGTADALAAVDEAVAASRPPQPLAVLEPVTPTTTTVALADSLAVHDHTTGEVHLLDGAAAVLWLAVPPGGGVAAAVAAATASVGPDGADPGVLRATADRLGVLGLLDP